MTDESRHGVREATLIQAVINSISAPVFFKSADGLYLGCNDAFEEFVGRKREEIVGKGVFELWDEDLARVYDQADRALMEAGGKQIYEAQVAYADGSIHDVMFHKSVFLVEEDGSSGIVGVMLDITERKEAERKLEHMARTDMLTGLGNRVAFYDSLELACKRADRHQVDLALLALDLDDFKKVNDTFGHPCGDSLLVEVAKRLKDAVRETDLVTRVGGDEFFIILEDIGNKEDVAVVSRKIIDSLSEPYVLGEAHQVNVGISIGIALYEVDGTDSQALVRRADAALYDVKHRTKGGFAFTDGEPVIVTDGRDRMT